VFRIALGAVLFLDVLRRYPEVGSHYSNSGWLTNHFMLFRPMSEHLFSVYLAFSSPNEVRFLMQLHMLLCLVFMIGWRTRLVHGLLAILLVSINSRNLMLENGGFVVLTLLTAWTLFLPLGMRFSLDAVLASLRLRRENGADALNDRSDPPRPTEPVVSLAILALILQWIVIYAFNVLQKNGPEWKDGTAVYYLFHQDRVITGLAASVRDAIPLGAFKAMTYAGLAIEGLIALLLASPVRSERTRMVAWALAAALHLSIAAVVDLGPFSWAMIIMFIVLAPPSLWESMKKRFDARYPRLDAYFDRESGFWIGFLRWVKRFDVLGHVQFVPVTVSGRRGAVSEAIDDDEDEEEEGDEDDEEDDEEEEDDDDEPEDEGKAGDGGTARERVARGVPEHLVKKTFVVEWQKDGARVTGMDALFTLAKAIPLGWFLTLPLRLPGVRGFVARTLTRGARRPAELDEYFDVETLPTEPERRAPEPTPARIALSRFLATLRESAVLLLMVVSGVELLVENEIVPARLKPQEPSWMRAMIVYPRLFQGWSMFAPSPPLRDGRLVVDGVTATGRRLDPLTGEAPVFEVAPPSARRMNQMWGEFHRRVAGANLAPYMEGLKDFIRRHHEVVKRPDEKLVAFEAWYVTEEIPAPGGKKKPPERRMLFSDGVMPGSAPLGPRREP
jgi:hypothetical protein